MYSTRIKALREEYDGLMNFCNKNNQVSFAMYIDNIYKKSLLLSAASYFEDAISNAVHNFSVDVSQGKTSLVSFVDNKALKRQYHTFFNWEANNTNQFWGLFGEDFKEKAKKQIEEKNLEIAARDFIAIGNDRNCLVHQNYIEMTINSTFNEIYQKYESACKFVEFILQMFQDEKEKK